MDNRLVRPFLRRRSGGEEVNQNPVRCRSGIGIGIGSDTKRKRAEQGRLKGAFKGKRKK
jgi:hypothetical protein